MSDEKVFEVKDNIMSLGITEDYVWYNSERLISDMNRWEFEFKRIVSVMEDRHKEHLKIISDLLQEIKKLKGKTNE